MDCTRRTSNGKPGRRLLCPVDFHAAEVLPGIDAKTADGLAYLAHAIIMRRVTAPRCVDELGFVPLNGAILKRVLGHRVWPRVRRAALDSGLIECNESYIPGERSKGYRFEPRFGDSAWEWQEIRDGRLAERFRRWREQDRERVWERLRSGQAPVPLDVVEHLLRHLRRVRIDPADAIDEPLTRETALAADFIRRGEWRIDVDDYGRVHTNLTNCKRELRRFLSVDGRRLVNVDIANSQPLFLAVLLEGGEGGREEEGGGEEGREPYVVRAGAGRLCGARGGPAGLREFLDACERGEFYGRVAGCLGGALDYSTLKRRVLAALFDRPSHRNRVHDAIGRAFPGVLEALARLKRRNYRRAAHLAQRAESGFMFGRVVPRIIRERSGLFIATIHDSILTTAGDEGYIRQVMLEEFGRLGVSPTVKVEQC